MKEVRDSPGRELLRDTINLIGESPEMARLEAAFFFRFEDYGWWIRGERQATYALAA